MMGPGKLLGSDSVSFKKSASQVPHNAMSRIFIVIRNIKIGIQRLSMEKFQQALYLMVAFSFLVTKKLPCNLYLF